MILPGSASQSLAAALADELDRPLGAVGYERFADGELLVEVPESLAETEAVVVCSTTSSDAHLELLQLQDAAREAGAERVTTVLPYMGYARQDRAFTPGQPVSARAVARAVSTGADRIVLVDPHEPAVAEFFEAPCETVEAAPLLAGPLGDLREPLFLGPDAKALSLAERLRDAYGTGTADYFEKHRDYDTGEVTVHPRETDADGRDAVIVDDIVATGGTVAGAAEALQDAGARRVVAACVHPMLAGNARARLARAGVDRIVATDTVERPCSVVSAAPAVAGALR
jgi:ribose-phosphate pyrophosphokinase